jgi:hypothetical protein
LSSTTTDSSTPSSSSTFITLTVDETIGTQPDQSISSFITLIVSTSGGAALGLILAFLARRRGGS